ncbi:alpha/beta-hydrolase [Xylaria palmicola]|nr:alpha/beta-hydrolase [Xylaria palmicola]
MAAATQTKPTLMIVHGGWHVPESYEKLVTALEAEGYEVHVPRLPSANQVRPPNGDLESDTALVRGYVESLVRAGRDVVAILHSYGVKSAPTPLKEFGNMDLVPVAFDIAEDGSCLSRDPKGLVVGPMFDDAKLDDAEIDKYLATFVRWNGNCMYQATQHAAWREIPVTFIYTTADMTVPIAYQKNFVEGLEKAGRKVQTFELPTGHCPNFTATEGVLNAIKATAV